MAKENIKDIENKVKAIYGETEIFFNVRSALQSLAWKIEIASYHCNEATCILDKVQRENSTLCFVDNFINARGRFDKEFLAILAHMIACAHNIHSLADILAHALCYALNLNAEMEPKELEKISVLRIKKKLQHSKYKELSLLVEKFTDSREFKYLSAFVNTTKHRNLVSSGYVGDLENNTYSYKIHKFEHKKRTIQKKSLRFF